MTQDLFSESKLLSVRLLTAGLFSWGLTSIYLCKHEHKKGGMDEKGLTWDKNTSFFCHTSFSGWQSPPQRNILTIEQRPEKRRAR